MADEKFSKSLKYWITSAEYRSIGDDEKSIYYKIAYLRDKNVTYDAIMSHFHLSSPSIITSAVKAIKADREPGKSGKPLTLTISEEEMLLIKIKESKELKKATTFKDLKEMVFKCLIFDYLH